MDMFKTLALHFKEGGWGMYPILVCFIITVAILIDRLSALYGRHNIDKEAFLAGLKKHIFAGDLEQAISYTASQKQTPLTAIVKAGLMQVEKGDAEVQAAMDEASLREMPKVEARTVAEHRRLVGEAFGDLVFEARDAGLELERRRDDGLGVGT